MKKLLTVFAGFVLVLALGFAAVACDTGSTNDGNDDDQPGTTVAVESVTLDKTSATLGVGETLTLTATVAPANATDKTVAWTTSDEDVATVSDGTVTAVAEGEATITATAGGKSATCTVTVDDGLVDAALGEWVKDRTDPAEWTVEDGEITLTTKTEPANNWYAWQGRKSAVTMPAAEEWSVSTSLDLSEDVLARSGVRTSVWLNVQNAEGQSIDWAIIQYYCDENGTKSWQYWVSEGAGEWKDIEGVVPSAGTHDLKIAFADGGIAMYIDGEESVNYDYTDVTSCKVAEVIVQSFSYGESYTVTWGVPEISFAPVVVSDAEELAAAVAAAQDGSVILVDGEIALTQTLTLSGKAVTVKGLEGSKIVVSGSLVAFDMQGGGSTLDGLTIEKTDKTSVGGLIMLGTDGTVKNCTITGQYELGDDETVRGIVQYAGSQNITVTGNTFTALRQPAYLEGSGTVSGNTVSGTRGFVVTGNSTVELKDNVFSDNAVDIAIIDNGGTTNNYAGQTVSLSAANNNCFVENQISLERCDDGETLETYTV